LSILYLGDGPIQGPASYLYSVLTHLGYKVSHVVPGKKPSKTSLNNKTKLLILSDYAYGDFKSIENEVIDRIREGSLSLLKVGGWGSFGSGGYKKSKLAKILPIKISKTDDRLNYSPGLRALPQKKHILTKGLSFREGSIICGLNTVTAKPKSQVVMDAKPLRYDSTSKIRTQNSGYPLLVISQSKTQKVACFTTDFAPHWAGGLVDWGKKRQRIHIKKKDVAVEVGECYIRLISNITNWLLN
jgi:uncharacterized membrane protein